MPDARELVNPRLQHTETPRRGRLPLKALNVVQRAKLESTTRETKRARQSTLSFVIEGEETIEE
jgi:hypothetical protein